MAEGSGKARVREISLGDDFGDVVVSANGARVEIRHDGIVITKPAPANDTAAKGKTEIARIGVVGPDEALSQEDFGLRVAELAKSGTANDTALHDNYLLQLQNALDMALRATVGLPDKAHVERSRIVYALAMAKGATAGLVTYAPGTVITKPGPANDTASKATHEIGVIESTGEHKGEIYGGVFPDGKRGWISEEPKPMSHYDAVELKGRALPTSEEGKYIDTIKGKGALKNLFARHSDGSSSAGFFWLAEHGIFNARSQQFSDGSQNHLNFRYDHLPVLSVRR